MTPSDHQPMALPRPSGGKASNTKDWEMGTRGDANTPCANRYTTIS